MLTSPKNRIFNPARKANFKRMGLAMQWPEVFLSSTFKSLKIGEIVYRSVAEAGKQWHALLNSWIATRIAELRDNEKRAGSQADDMVSAVMRYRDPDTGELLNDADLTAELTTLLIAVTKVLQVTYDHVRASHETSHMKFSPLRWQAGPRL